MSAATGTPFTTRAVILGVAAAVGGFLLFLVASAYAPDFAPRQGGQAHALSKSAVGYAGLRRLIDEAGDGSSLSEAGTARDLDELMIVTPRTGTAPDELDELLLERDGGPTLLILPSAEVEPLPGHRGWVWRVTAEPYSLVLEGRDGVSLKQVKGSKASSIEGEQVYPIVRNKAGAVILGEVRGENLFVLTDADRLNNAGIATLEGARGALKILEEVRPADTPIVMFDLTLAGFGAEPSLLKLMFEPPFVGLTACLLAAALLAGWMSAVRFGAPAAEGRAVPLGKRSLVDNTAALLRRAGRTHAVGGLYAEGVRGRIARARHGATAAPLRLTEGDSAQLDRLTHEMATANTDARLLHAARALHEFKRGMTT